MAYRIDISARDRSGAVIAVIAIHAALLLVFLHLAGKLDIGDTQPALSVFDLANPPPPPPPEKRSAAKPKQKPGHSAPRNIKSKATPVPAPKPKVQSPALKVIVASTTPNKGSAPTQGAASVAGPGTGAGGSGTGTGSGGTGPGGGGDNGVAEPPRLASPVLSGYDFSRDMLNQWPRGVTIFLRLRVDPRGYVSECMVDRGTGVALIDSAICNLAYERLRFRPALNRGGQAVAGWFGYAQPAPR